MSQQKRKTLQVQITHEPPRHISHNNPIHFQILRSYALKLLKKKFREYEYSSKVQSALWKLVDHPQVSLPTKSCPHDLRSFHISRADYNNNQHSRSVTGALAVGDGMRAGWVKREPMEIRSPEGLRRRNSSWNLAMWTEQGTGVSFRTFQRRLTCLNVG